MGLCYLNWTLNTFTSRDSMTLLCNRFQCLSMPTLVSLFILSPLLQFKPLFYLPSITDTVRRLFLAIEACVFENVPLHLPSGSEELWIPQLPLTGHTFPTALRHLDTPVLPAALCSASSMCCSELDTSFQLRPCKHAAKRKGHFPCPTGFTPVYTLEHDIFLCSLGLLTHI